MIEQDTVRLLRECDAGIRMGVASIDEVLDNARDDALIRRLDDCKDDHLRLQREILDLLGDYRDGGKEPNAMAKGMSWMKTNVNLTLNESDATIADLMTDGCNMGIKSLAKYLNQFAAASEQAKDIAKRLINLEERLVRDLRDYL